jgi:hypothetical protein
MAHCATHHCKIRAMVQRSKARTPRPPNRQRRFGGGTRFGAQRSFFRVWVPLTLSNSRTYLNPVLNVIPILDTPTFAVLCYMLRI